MEVVKALTASKAILAPLDRIVITTSTIERIAIIVPVATPGPHQIRTTGSITNNTNAYRVSTARSAVFIRFQLSPVGPLAAAAKADIFRIQARIAIREECTRITNMERPNTEIRMGKRRILDEKIPISIHRRDTIITAVPIKTFRRMETLRCSQVHR